MEEYHVVYNIAFFLPQKYLLNHDYHHHFGMLQRARVLESFNDCSSIEDIWMFTTYQIYFTV